MLAVKFGEISRRDRPNREIPRKHFLIRFWLNAKFLQISRFTARVEMVLGRVLLGQTATIDTLVAMGKWIDGQGQTIETL